MKNFKKTVALGAILLLVGGCNASAASKAALPDGETDLSCGASVYAAANLLEDQGVSSKDVGSVGDSLAAVTRYGTAYATSKGISGEEAFAEIKLEAYRMTGKVPGASVISSTKTILRRAKACMGS